MLRDSTSKKAQETKVSHQCLSSISSTTQVINYVQSFQISNRLYVACFTDTNDDQSFVLLRMTNGLALSNVRHIDDEPYVPIQITNALASSDDFSYHNVFFSKFEHNLL